MILAVDVGNTNLVFALVDQGEIRARWRIRGLILRRTADHIRSGFINCWSWKGSAETMFRA